MEIKLGPDCYNLNDIVDVRKFEDPGFTKAIYKADIKSLLGEKVGGTIRDVDGQAKHVDLNLFQWSQYRILKLQESLSNQFVNYNGHIEMLLASAIAQEPVLFIGRPGTGKSELAFKFFNGIGLRTPSEEQADRKDLYKYFEYLLSSFSIPEELFGALNLSKLTDEKSPQVTRINNNMMTGKRVAGVFLDEVFNASSSILNTLLTLINERRYFDKGQFQPADLKVFIGASNQTPVGPQDTTGGSSGMKGNELRAFYDRFTIRLYFPTPQEIYHGNERKIRETYRDIGEKSRERVMEKLSKERPSEFEQIACLNDFLLLGRLLGKIEFPDEVKGLMYNMVSDFAAPRQKGSRLCYMSPRKANKLSPVVIANAFLFPQERLEKLQDRPLTSEIIEYIKNSFPLRVTTKNLQVFNHIWDYEGDRAELQNEVKILLDQFS